LPSWKVNSNGTCIRDRFRLASRQFQFGFCLLVDQNSTKSLLFLAPSTVNRIFDNLRCGNGCFRIKEPSRLQEQQPSSNLIYEKEKTQTEIDGKLIGIDRDTSHAIYFQLARNRHRAESKYEKNGNGTKTYHHTSTRQIAETIETRWHQKLRQVKL